MPQKPHTLWLLLALSLTLLMCMILTASSVIFATHSDGDLQRYPGCFAFGTPIWRYRDATDPGYDGYNVMPQKTRTAFLYICYPPGT